MSNILRLLSGTLRTFRRNQRFAVTVIVVLALGIGINVATLGLLYRYYVSPLPYTQGGRVVNVCITVNVPGAASCSAMGRNEFHVRMNLMHADRCTGMV